MQGDLFSSAASTTSLFEQHLFEHNDSNSWILTPNQPVAQQLRRARLQHYINESKAHKNAIPSCHISVFSAWLGPLLENILVETNSTLALANNQQLTYLWQTILRQHETEFQGLNPYFLASQALSAWQNIHRWQVSYQQLTEAESEQLIQFSRWIPDFEKALLNAQLIAPEQLIQQQLDQLSSVNRYNVLWLYGFIDRLPPLWQHWVEQCFKQVVDQPFQHFRSHIHTRAQAKKQSTGSFYQAQNSESELQHAAHWAAQQCVKYPNKRIGIIYTHLGDHPQKTARIVKQAVDNHCANSNHTQEIRISFARGSSLLENSAIRTAFSLLQLNTKYLSRAQAREIIHSKYWGNWQANYELRARWDELLCAQQSSQILPRAFAELIDKIISANACDTTDNDTVITETRTALLNFFNTNANKSQYATPEQWAERFYLQLQHLAWEPLSHKTDHQASLNDIREHWLNGLKDLCLLTPVTGQISVATALQLLKQALSKAQTDPSAAHAGIRILDTVESASDFDALWLTGVDSQQWPGTPRPNSLLPVRLQIEMAMPRTSSERETAVAKALFARIKIATPEYVISYAQFQGELELSPSALIPSALNTLNLSIPTTTSTNKTIATEWVDWTNAPALTPAEHHIHQGANLFKTLATSPLRAFLRWRLFAEPLAEVKFGLDAADRGSLIHQVLEQLWTELSDSSTLKNMDPASLLILCKKVAENQLRQWLSRKSWRQGGDTPVLSQRFFNLESERLSQLALEWLQLDAQRPDFQVLACEQPLDINIEGICFKMRLDRLDQQQGGTKTASNGPHILIDYKTSRQLSISSWDSEQGPKEPQLPLYALHLATPPSALYFAKVRPNECAWIGLTEQPLFGQFTEANDWSATLTQWQQQFKQLAMQYKQGLCIGYDIKATPFEPNYWASIERFTEYEYLQQLYTEHLQTTTHTATEHLS